MKQLLSASSLVLTPELRQKLFTLRKKEYLENYMKMSTGMLDHLRFHFLWHKNRRLLIQHSLSTAFPFFFLIQAVDRYSFSPISNSSWRRTTSSISFPTLVTSFVSVLERRKCHEKKLVLSASESWIRNWLRHLQLFYYNSLWPQGQRLGISFLCHRTLPGATNPF